MTDRGEVDVDQSHKEKRASYTPPRQKNGFVYDVLVATCGGVAVGLLGSALLLWIVGNGGNGDFVRHLLRDLAWPLAVALLVFAFSLGAILANVWYGRRGRR